MATSRRRARITVEVARARAAVLWEAYEHLSTRPFEALGELGQVEFAMALLMRETQRWERIAERLESAES